jgi:hypothetical protein
MRANQYGIHPVLKRGELYLRVVANGTLPVDDLKCHCACICNAFLQRVTYFHVSVFSVGAHTTSVRDHIY